MTPAWPDWQSALHPGGPGAASLHWLFWVFVIICGVVWALVMLVLAAALRRRTTAVVAPLAANEPGERRSAMIVSLAVGATVLIIFCLTVLSYAATRGLAGAADDALVVRVRGYQWWWEVTYPGATPDQRIVTANEIHIPVGRSVRVELAAADVIHSFWVPNLAGKQDQIPGRANTLTLQADRSGVYRGQCAEFCGLQHARMALLVIAEPADAFEAWRAAQRTAAAIPTSEEEQAGRKVVNGKACAGCHTVRGTDAAGRLGPDLTHVAGRQFIAAGVLPTTRGSLAAWIADPQTIKPGNNMPMVTLTADELRAVSAYLAALR